MTTNADAPKLFISYSWSNTDHEQWVVQLAESLVDSGVDVVLDKWDLREGNDAIAFMEKMVADPAIKKVVMICDETYARKADGRDGGVGTETQIISKNVYENTSQDKFVAILATRDSEGKPYLPTYYTSRIYIDLSDGDQYAAEFEKLLRWIFDKPLYVRPTMGKRPTFIDEPDSVSLGTSAIYRRCIDALKQGKSFASGSLDEYFGTFATNLERLRIVKKDGELDDAVVTSIEEFTPYRNEIISILQVIAQYAPTIENGEKVHRFLEQIFDYTRRPLSVRSYSDFDFDNFKFIVNELFLYALAVFLRQERFDLANLLLERPYYIRDDDLRASPSALPYRAFNLTPGCLERRNQRLQRRRFSLHADMLHDRASTSGLDFRHLMQADFVAFMRSEIESPNQWNSWWPTTLLYVDRHHTAFEIFARSASCAYFEKAKVVLGVTKKQEIDSVLALYEQGTRECPRFGYTRLNPAVLLGADGLCTRR